MPLTCATEVQASVEVVRQLQDLESSFALMLAKLRRLLTKCNLAEVKFFLENLLATDELRRCSTFDEVLHQLCREYIDTFSIDCLERLAALCQNHKMDRLIKRYKGKKKDFLTKTTVHEFQQAIISRVDPVPPSKKTTITIKIPPDLSNRKTLNDMEKLAKKAFGPYHKSFIFLHAKPGCTLITWFSPKTLATQLKLLALEKKDLFTKEGVLEVTVAGVVVFSCIQKVFEEVSVKETSHNA